MMRDLYALMRPVLFSLPPETTHKLSLIALKTGIFNLSPCLNEQDSQLLQLDIAGLRFRNPIGMAAGFDKNAEIIDPILNLGFGFTEIGTVTPRPQTGNARPRLFRLVQDKAIINRMGFNNHGHEAVYQNLAKRQARFAHMRTPAAAEKTVTSDKAAKEMPEVQHKEAWAKRAAEIIKNKTGLRLCCCAAENGRVGVNIGVNKDSVEKIADYGLGLVKFYPVADYFAVNISSPNTPGLRDLQGREKLRALLALLTETNAALATQYGFKRPIFLKIAPDLTENALDDIAAEFLAQPLDGVIIANTTISRPNVTDKLAGEAGGLSGKPLFPLSTIVLAKMRQKLGKNVPLIGVGGVCDSQTALTKIAAGADMVQIYSGLIYQGAWVVPAIVKGLSAACRQAGVAHISALRDTETADWAKKPLSNDA